MKKLDKAYNKPKSKKAVTPYASGGGRQSCDVFSCEKCGQSVRYDQANKHWKKCVSRKVI